MARARYSLAGKSVLITGAARGIGAEVARHAARRGARVSLVGLEPEMLERVAAECGLDAVWFEADVRDREALERAVDGTVDRLGGIDVAMANAGVATGGAIAHADLSRLEQVVEINLIGAIRTFKLCLPHVSARRGYLLQNASVSAIGPAPGLAAYSASKCGVEGFANALRMEVRHRGVDVGVAYYSWIDTELVRGGDEHPDFELLRGSLRWPLSKTYPATRAAEATIRGIERRSRWIAYPGWIKAMILVRGVVPHLTETQLGDNMAELDRLGAEKVERMGDDATALAGAGGEAAMRAQRVD
ncbi:MAG TPA: short-chain dehydrogenase/reductase [Thermoleophilaceae bacterium]|nr:short-chain dehydrogenase/reductase [Thermoleophilaceae bacterium]